MYKFNQDYRIFTEEKNGEIHYYVTFEDVNKNRLCVEITRELYLEFLKFNRLERNLQRFDERHIERFSLSDMQLYQRASKRPLSLLDKVILDETIRNIVSTLPELSDKQRRRFILYYFHELTYEQIAKAEGCTKMAVKFSVASAKKIILKNM